MATVLSGYARNVTCGIPTYGYMGFSKRRSSPRARAVRAVHTPLQISGELRRGIRN